MREEPNFWRLDKEEGWQKVASTCGYSVSWLGVTIVGSGAQATVTGGIVYVGGLVMNCKMLEGRNMTKGSIRPQK